MNIPEDWTVDFDIENTALIVIDPVDDFDFHSNLVVAME